MPKITRVQQKIFAANATNSGQFGSAQLGTKLNTEDLATIQALAAFEEGWNSATVSGERLPTLEEMQGLDKLTTTQIAYLFQEGIAEYDVNTTYFIRSIVKKVGTYELYGSLIDDNIGNALPSQVNDANWQYLGDLADYVRDGSITAAKLANNAVTTDKILDGSVTEAKISFTAFNNVFMQVITASGTYTPTAGMVKCLVEVQGGGGGGGGCPFASTTGRSAGGGGGGGYSRRLFTAAEIGASQSVTIGAGGSGGAAGGVNSGNSGGSSTFGAYITCSGGTGGSGAVDNSTDSGDGGVGGTSSGGDYNANGQYGSDGDGNGTSERKASGQGGSSYFGGGGPSRYVGPSNSKPGRVGAANGAGGSGGVNRSGGAATAGGSGANGIIIITEFIG